MKVLLCTIVKNEENYIDEFIEHYKELGFANVILYDNNDDKSVFYNDDFVIVDYSYIGKKLAQLNCYAKCYDDYKNDYDWIAFFDADELLMLNNDKYKDINDYLSNEKFNDYNLIKLNWKCYGDNDIEECTSYKLKTRFINPLPEDVSIKRINFKINEHIKSIVRCKSDIKLIWKQPHCPHNILNNCDCSGNKINNNLPKNKINFEDAWVNHYITKTINEYIQKIDRGWPDRPAGLATRINILNEFFEYNKETPYKRQQIDNYISYKVNSNIEKSNKYDIRVALVAICRLENNYLLEWISYYLNIGIDKIILGDNNFDGEDNVEELVKDYIAKGVLDLKDERNKILIQDDFYNRMYDEYKNQFDWICFFDIDEFLVFSESLETYNIKEYLSLSIFDNYDVIKINWLIFGDNNITFDNKNYSVVDRFKCPVTPMNFSLPGQKLNNLPFLPLNLMVKSIVRCYPNAKTNFAVHFPANKCNFCNNKGEPELPMPINKSINYDYAQLNHYVTKTLDEYIQKINRGEPCRNFNEKDKIKKLLSFFDYNKNSVTYENLNKVRDYIEKILPDREDKKLS